jgi:hypothetical protein
MDEVFSALIAIIADHGTGEDGWMNARREVYDTVCFIVSQNSFTPFPSSFTESDYSIFQPPSVFHAFARPELSRQPLVR